jgi:hypothetical protein
MYAKAGELGLPVGHMPFKGFMLHAGNWAAGKFDPKGVYTPFGSNCRSFWICIHTSSSTCAAAGVYADDVEMLMAHYPGTLILLLLLVVLLLVLVSADEIETLLADYPNTRAIIDHCGFCNCSDLQSTEWKRLLSLARYPQVCLALPKCTAVPSVRYNRCVHMFVAAAS